MDPIARSRKGDIDILTIKGSIGHTDVTEFEKVMEDALKNGSRNIVIDLGGMNHVCSSALGALISFKRRLRREDGDIRMVDANGDVLRVFQITLLDRVFMMFDTVEAAVHSFQIRGQGHENP